MVVVGGRVVVLLLMVEVLLDDEVVGTAVVVVVETVPLRIMVWIDCVTLRFPTSSDASHHHQ